MSTKYMKEVNLFAALSLILTLCIPGVKAQTPGGISAPGIWVKADQGVLNSADFPATNNNSVKTWTDLSGNALHLQQLVAANSPLFLTGAYNSFNYNPILSFDGNGNEAQSDFLSVASPGVFRVSGAPYQHINTYVVYQDLNSNNMDWLLYQGADGFSRYSYYFNYSGNTSATFDITTTYRLNGSTNEIGLLPNIVALNGGLTSIYGQNSNANRAFMLNGKQLDMGNTFYAPGSGFPGIDRAFFVGREAIGTEGAHNSFGGYLAELVIFNKALTAIERRRIESYLAIKYAKTLDNTAGLPHGNYLSSEGSTVWSAHDFPIFHRDVLGIGRDDNSGLIQKQSHTVSDNFRIYLSSLQATNIQNDGNFSGDLKFVLTGNNGAALHSTGSIEFPNGIGIHSRIDREWKISNTAFDGSFSMDITLTTNVVNPAHIRILVDDDDNFTNATMYNPTISVTGNTITIHNIDNSMIPLGSTRFLTLVSVNSVTALPLEFLSVTGIRVDTKVNIRWETVNEINNSHFTIERSSDGVTWNTIGSVTAATVNESINTYNFVDYSSEGSFYYRIKQHDLNGKFSYSNVVRFPLNTTRQAKLKSWSIPGTRGLIVQWESGDANVKITDAFIYDLNGGIIKKLNLVSGQEVIVDNLFSGIYFLRAGQHVARVLVY